MREDLNEKALSEDPAVHLLGELGYTYLEPFEVEPLREGARSSVLVKPLGEALKRLNPWLSDDNLAKAVRAVTTLGASSLMEANERLYTILTRGISVTQDRGDGPKGHTVRFIDFEEPHNNRYHVTRQFRVKGARVEVVFDVVVFVNGLPLAVIECKSPTIDLPLEEGVKRLMRYQEAEEQFRGRGAPQAFEATQLVIAVARDAAAYATTGATARAFSPFPEVYPKPGVPLEELTGGPLTAQDILLYGLLAPPNLLEFVRDLVVFEAEGGGVVKKIARYPQRIAVDQAVARVLAHDKPEARGGVIWHTQGSGKSLTMVWLAQKLRREALGLGNPTLVIVTDRTDLDQQIANTFHRVGFPNPQQARGVAHLRELLRKGNGLTILTTLQKFDEAAGEAALNGAKNLFVMVDEAHRGQYSERAARMRAALPNATFFAFTGTPIDKEERSTFGVFGPYLHKYTLERSVADRSTLEIFYEARELERFGIEGRDLDVLEARLLGEYPLEEREAIKRKLGTWEKALAAAPKRINAVALDLVEHFETAIRPNGFKAQLVASSREAAVRYKRALDKIPGAPESAVLMTSGLDDSEELAAFHTTKGERKALIRRFKKREDPLAIIIVVDMLLTGFDAPVEQVMYLDRGLKEHGLLQAIARVNRPAEGKDYGLIVDYWGVSEDLQEALASFDAGELGVPMRAKSDQLETLRLRHARAMRVFEGIDKSDYDALLRRLEPEDARADFDAKFRAFAQSLDLFYPDPQALGFSDDFKWLGALRRAAKNRFRDPKLTDEGVADKVKRLIEEHVSASGVVTLLGSVSILSPVFDERLGALDSDEARASEMAHAVQHQISEQESENPVFYASLKERLNEIIEARKKQRLSAVEQLQQLFPLRELLRKGTQSEAERLGLSETGYAFYKLLEAANLNSAEGKPLAESLEHAIEEHLVLDWAEKDDVKRLMRRDLRRSLLRGGVGREAAEALIPKIMSTAEARLARG